MYDINGVHLSEEEQNLNQPNISQVQHYKDFYISFIAPKQEGHIVEAIKNYNWITKIALERKSDGILSDKKLDFEFVPHQLNDWLISCCIFCDLKPDAPSSSSMDSPGLVQAKKRAAPNRKKRKMTGSVCNYNNYSNTRGSSIEVDNDDPDSTLAAFSTNPPSFHSVERRSFHTDTETNGTLENDLYVEPMYTPMGSPALYPRFSGLYQDQMTDDETPLDQPDRSLETPPPIINMETTPPIINMETTPPIINMEIQQSGDMPTINTGSLTRGHRRIPEETMRLEQRDMRLENRDMSYSLRQLAILLPVLLAVPYFAPPTESPAWFILGVLLCIWLGRGLLQ